MTKSQNTKDEQQKDLCITSEQLTEQWKVLLAENTKLKELLKECELWFTGIVGNINDKNVGEHNRNIPIGNFEHAFRTFSQKINQVLADNKIQANTVGCNKIQEIEELNK